MTEWPSSFMEGVGQVPGGPRGSVPGRASSGTPIVLNSDSTVVGTNCSPGPHLRGVSIKEELQDDTIPLMETAELSSGSDPVAEDEEIGLDVPAEEDISLDDFPDVMHTFRSMLAAHNRPGRSSSDASHRQREYEGPVRDRNERRRSTTHERSRSPVSSRQGSPLFYPETPRRGGRRSESTLTSPASFTASPISSTPKTPRNPRNKTLDEVGKDCTCPVSYKCLHRRADVLDCRELVPEQSPAWEERDAEDYESQRSVGATGEKFTENNVLTSIVDYVNAFEKATSSHYRKQAVKYMETWVLEMEDVTLRSERQEEIASTQVVPRLSQFLSPQNRAVRKRGKLPDYIEEELTVLQRKWGRGDFSGTIKRGLIAKEVLDVNGIVRRTTYELNKTWPFHREGTYFGEGDLVNGQIWMSRVELCRDGVHAPIQAGIGGTVKKGARSVVLGKYDEDNEKGYANIDMGEVIEYMGTALPEEADTLQPTNIEDPHMHHPDSWNRSREPTASTKAMMKSFETGKPVRVIRSAKMSSKVPNKPRMGYRYDGLYKVTGMTPMKETRQIWSFRLERLPDQGRLRGFPKHAAQPDASGRRKGHNYHGQ